jgi:hypothetical protein
VELGVSALHNRAPPFDVEHNDSGHAVLVELHRLDARAAFHIADRIALH